MNLHKLQAAIESAIYKLTEDRLELYERDKQAFYAVLDKMVSDEVKRIGCV